MQHHDFKSAPLASKDILTQACTALNAIRGQRPHVHCLTNSVAENFTANVLLALGASPSMSVEPEEIASLVSHADAVLINLGAPDEARKRSYKIAAKTARSLGKPFVLDPVFVERSPQRLAMAKELTGLQPAAVRGNAEEINALALTNPATIIVETGEQDQISFQGHSLRIGNGTPLMASITGAGCALGAVMAATLGAHKNPLEAVAASLLIFGVAGALAAEKAEGPGSFIPVFLDRLFSLSGNNILAHGQVLVL